MTDQPREPLDEEALARIKDAMRRGDRQIIVTKTRTGYRVERISLAPLEGEERTAQLSVLD